MSTSSTSPTTSSSTSPITSSSTSPINPPPTPPIKTNFVIDFLDHNGARALVALLVVFGAILITLKSGEVCVIRENSTQTPTTSGTQSPTVIRENSVCSRYFEMAALVLGGIIGLSEPGIRKRKTTTERSD